MMNETPDERQLHSRDGLCARCLWARVVVNDRGGRFVRCARAGIDPRFPKYPVLPVGRCAGYEPAPVPR